MTAPSDEAAFARQVLSALHPFFRIHAQREGSHFSGKRFRIDAILTPRDPELWARPDIALGVEFKALSDSSTGMRHRKDNAKIISQCIDYSLTSWDDFGHVPVFFCPGFKEIRASQHFPRENSWSAGYQCGVGSMMAGVMGQNNVGELVHSSHLGWAFLMHGSHRIWSQRLGRSSAGVGVGKHNKLIRKLGSR